MKEDVTCVDYNSERQQQETHHTEADTAKPQEAEKNWKTSEKG
jgi:hypothetical protein